MINTSCFKQAVLHGAGRVRIESREIPEKLPADAILIKASRSIISPGTELAAYHGLIRADKYPYVPGYAAAGSVIAKGANVNHLAEGDYVYYPGFHSELMCLRNATAAVKLQSESEVEFAPYARFFQIAYTALDVVAERWMGARILVVGLGLIGNLVGQLASVLGGAQVLGIDSHQVRCDIAKRYGFDATFVPTQFPEDHQADVIIDATGTSTALTSAMRWARKGGDIVLLGTPRSPIMLDAQEIHRMGLQIAGAHESRLSIDRKTEVAGQMLNHLRQNRLKTSLLSTGMCEIAELELAYRRLEHKDDGLTHTIAY